jgi:hypothetical protein
VGAAGETQAIGDLVDAVVREDQGLGCRRNAAFNHELGGRAAHTLPETEFAQKTRTKK